MNNLSPTSPRSQQPQTADVLPRSFLLRRLYDLPIDRKTSLIPWFSCSGLLLLLGVGGLVLQGTLKQQLWLQSKSQLELKSRLVRLSQTELDDKSALAQTVAAMTKQQGYSAVYALQAEDLTLISSALKTGEATQVDISLPQTQILDRAIANRGGIAEQVVTISGQKYAVVAQGISGVDGKPLGVIVHGSSLGSSNFVLRNSLLAQGILSLIISIFIVYLSKILNRAIAEPIQSLQKVAQDFSGGDFSVRASINSRDEVGLLSSTFNVLADSIELNEARLKQDAERSQLLQEIAYSISEAVSVDEVWQTAVNSSRNVLQCDRVIYHHFQTAEQGTVMAESVQEGFPVALGREIKDPCFAEGPATAYQQGKVSAITNIYQSNLQECHLKMLEPLAVVATLVTPVITANKLTGLLIAHQCSEARAWQADEISLLTQIAQQVGGTVEKIELLEQQQQAQQQERAAKENLQRRALELLMEVDAVSQGDLTVQVKVQEDEIGTIGDSYNATIESLRKLVSQVKMAALQVSNTTSDKDRSLKELSTGASAQTAEINLALAKIQGIVDSIQAVAQNAKAAEAAMLKATETVKAGDEAMNQTVTGFQEIRDTVAATAKKVKRLGESSQKISKVVNVIGSFADQTNLLALNASIEAAHAGEEGRGFAVVADEVRSLARQSAEATAEIEALVAEIQAETNEVVAAMEAGTEQVVAGTKLVDKTRFSLVQIADVSTEIDRLVAEIAAATVEQSQDSEVVSQTMLEVAAISDKTAAEAGEVSASFQDLLTVAQQLESSVAKFKVS
ncbi:MAG: methyl-accepting chemotaxis protein [Cyanobacteria bacterium J06623_7]